MQRFTITGGRNSVSKRAAGHSHGGLVREGRDSHLGCGVISLRPTRGVLQPYPDSSARSVAAAALLIIALCASPTFAQSTYYVAPTGTDSVSCASAQTLTTPKRTINNAKGCVAPGDTVQIRGGTYAEMLFWEGGPRGTSWTQPIRFAAYPNESVTIRPPAGSNFALYLSNAGSGVDNGPRYLIFDRLTFDGVNIQSGAVVKVTEYDGKPSSQGGKPAHHIRFTNVRVTQNGSSEIQGYLIHAEFVEIIGGEIDHIGADTAQTGNAQGIYGAGSDLLVDGVNIHHIQGLGMSNISSLPGVDSHRHIIRNNIVHDNLKDGINEGEGSGHQIYNNVSYNNGGEGISLDGFGAGAATGITVFNNTIVGNAGKGLRINGDQTAVVVRNNLAYQNGASAADNYVNGGNGTVASNNLFDGTNPLFVNAAAADFHLQTGSPAINAGVAVAEVAADREGAMRGNPPELGAYEFGGTPSAPPPPPPPPATPATVTATPASVPVGSAVTVAFSTSTPTATDWIGLYRPGARNEDGALQWVYTSSGTQTPGLARATGSYPFVIPAALSYEFRLEAQDAFQLLATSNVVTGTAADPPTPPPVDPPPPPPPPLPPPPSDTELKALLTEIKALLSGPELRCVIASVGSPYSDGDLRYTVRCEKGALTFTSQEPIRLRR